MYAVFLGDAFLCHLRELTLMENQGILLLLYFFFSVCALMARKKIIQKKKNSQKPIDDLYASGANFHFVFIF